MTYSDLQALVYDLMGEPSTGNDDLTAARVQSALATGYRMFCDDTGCLTRDVRLTLADETMAYALPADVLRVKSKSVRYGTSAAIADITRLDYQTVDYLDEFYSATWRNDASDDPLYWSQEQPGTLLVVPMPDITVTTYLWLTAETVPHAAGTSITTIARSSNLLTVTTSTPHGMAVGHQFSVLKCPTSGLNVTTQTVKAVTSSTVFTADHTGSDESASSGYVLYAGGSLPLIDTTDAPSIPVLTHEALAQWAAWRLLTRFNREDSAALERARDCYLEYEDMTGRTRAQTVTY